MCWTSSHLLVPVHPISWPLNRSAWSPGRICYLSRRCLLSLRGAAGYKNLLSESGGSRRPHPKSGEVQQVRWVFRCLRDQRWYSSDLCSKTWFWLVWLWVPVCTPKPLYLSSTVLILNYWHQFDKEVTRQTCNICLCGNCPRLVILGTTGLQELQVWYKT